MLLHRYYLREFAKLFTLIGLGLTTVITLLSLVKKMGQFLPHDPSAWSIAYYAILTFPRYFLYLMPVAALMCSLYTIGHAARNRETVAIMAAGGRLRRILLPFVITGLLLSVLGFVLGEIVVPACSSRSVDLRNAITNKKVIPSLSQDGKMWLRTDDGSLVRIDLYIEGGNRFRGMSIFGMDQDGLREIIEAEEALYSENDEAWVLSGVRKYDITTGKITTLAEMDYPSLNSPSVFREEVWKPYELSFFELYRYLTRLENAGFRNLRLQVELNSKLSSPLVSLFMVILGVSFAARRTMGGLAATAVGLLVSLLYWMGFTMTLSLGYAGILHPIAATWIMPLSFGVAAVYMYMKIPE
jgi:lipopolysaccharide export system permease protein